MPHGRSPRHQRSPGTKRRRRPRPTSREGVPGDLAEPATGPVRLQKLIAAAGLDSRRGAEQYLRDGRVTVNGKVARLGDSADPQRDVVAVDGEKLARAVAAYWMLHKPAGVVTTVRDPQGRRTVLDLLPPGLPQLHPVGRLDAASTGLVLLTNDGALTHVLLHPSLGNEREYSVTIRGQLDTRTQRALERGVVLEEGRTAPARVGRVRLDPETDSSTFGLTLVEGRNRQIRRSLLALGRPVKRLVRVRIGPLRLGRLPRGEARPLRPEELVALRTHARALEARREERQRGPRATRRGRH